MEMNNATSALQVFKTNEEREKEKQKIEQEKSIERSISLTNLKLVYDQNEKIDSTNKILKNHTKEIKKNSIQSWIAIGVAIASLAVAIIALIIK